MKIHVILLLSSVYLLSTALFLKTHFYNGVWNQIVENESAIDSIALRNAFKGNYSISIPLSKMVISDIQYEEKHTKKSDKRACGAGSYVKYLILDSGNEVSSWEPASGCLYCSNNPRGECSADLQLHLNSFHTSIKKGELLAMRLNSTEKLSRSYQGPKSLNCDIYGFENVTQVHFQTTKRWAKMKKRTCVVSCWTTCTDWSDEYRTEAIVTEQTKVQCFKGYENVKCDS